MNDQRRVIYEQRSDIMDAETVDDVVADMRTETVNALVADHCPPGTYPEQWNVEGLKEAVGDILNLEPDIDAWRSEEHTSELQSLMRISYAVFCLKKKTR